MKVYLVGAGPGDPGLLTLRAKALLERADAVVYDYLAAESLLGHCRPDAERIYVGKQGGDHTLPQDEISSLLVAKAREGKVVVRLKGGDPYVFGRGAEEAETLVDAGVEFEVVPGVTSAVAALAYAGIPLTHRDHASAACLVTGHEDPAKAGSAIDWEALARSRATLVFYMGMKNLPDIAVNLMAHGLPGSTPAAVVRWGTTCMQRSPRRHPGHYRGRRPAAGIRPPGPHRGGRGGLVAGPAGLVREAAAFGPGRGGHAGSRTGQRTGRSP